MLRSMLVVFWFGSVSILANGQPPAPMALTPEVAERAFDQLWQDMDRNYSYFDLKQIDWPALKAKYRPKAQACKDVAEFVVVLKEMLAELKDMHIWMDTPTGRVGVYEIPWERNWSPPAIRAHLAKFDAIGKLAVVGTLKEGYGFLVFENQGAATPELAKLTVEKIEALADVPGFMVDLRGGATGGNEALAQPIAAAFCAKPVVYAKQKFRSGPAHNQFGQVFDRRLQAGAKPFTKPVVVLLGPRVMSSGEGMAKMFAALPNVTTVGSPTRGASGNPSPVDLKEVGVKVWYSRWVSMLPDGTPIEGRGVQPKIEAKFPVAEFGAKDPVFEKGLEVLGEKVKKD